MFAGSGNENIMDGTAASANFAQPSGLATDGENLFVADSEVSGVRVITGIRGQAARGADHRRPGPLRVRRQGRPRRGRPAPALPGTGLRRRTPLHRRHLQQQGQDLRAQEPLGPHAWSARTTPGDSDDPPHFYEPGGLSATEDRLYVADTNNHKIRVVDLKTHAVKTLALEGLTPPRLAPRPPSFPNKQVIDVPAAEAAPGKSIALDVSIPLAKGFKLNEEVPLTYLVETPEKSGVLGPEVLPEGQKIKPPATKFTITVPLAKPAAAGDKLDLRLSLQTFVCSEASSLCQIKSYVWNVPVTFTIRRRTGAHQIEQRGNEEMIRQDRASRSTQARCRMTNDIALGLQDQEDEEEALAAFAKAVNASWMTRMVRSWIL